MQTSPRGHPFPACTIKKRLQLIPTLPRSRPQIVTGVKRSLPPATSTVLDLGAANPSVSQVGAPPPAKLPRTLPPPLLPDNAHGMLAIYVVVIICCHHHMLSVLINPPYVITIHFYCKM